jgi:hypothetical protein
VAHADIFVGAAKPPLEQKVALGFFALHTLLSSIPRVYLTHVHRESNAAGGRDPSDRQVSSALLIVGITHVCNYMTTFLTEPTFLLPPFLLPTSQLAEYGYAQVCRSPVVHGPLALVGWACNRESVVLTKVMVGSMLNPLASTGGGRADTYIRLDQT